MEGFNVLVAHDGEQALELWMTASIYFCLTS